MKLFIAAFVSFILLHTTALAQLGYERQESDNGRVILNGIISDDILKAEPSFSWYASSQNGYTPNEGIVETVSAAKSKITFLVFMGTWCGDSHYIVPKFFSILDKAEFPKTDVTLIALDRRKKTFGHLTTVLNISRVPTIIVMKGGKEMGRIVEYGETGMWDNELAELIKMVD